MIKVYILKVGLKLIGEECSSDNLKIEVKDLLNLSVVRTQQGNELSFGKFIEFGDSRQIVELKQDDILTSYLPNDQILKNYKTARKQIVNKEIESNSGIVLPK